MVLQGHSVVLVTGPCTVCVCVLGHAGVCCWCHFLHSSISLLRCSHHTGKDGVSVSTRCGSSSLLLYQAVVSLRRGGVGRRGVGEGWSGEEGSGRGVEWGGGEWGRGGVGRRGVG